LRSGAGDKQICSQLLANLERDKQRQQDKDGCAGVGVGIQWTCTVSQRGVGAPISVRTVTAAAPRTVRIPSG